MEIFILFGLIMLNALFAMSEIAVVTARKSRLATLASGGYSHILPDQVTHEDIQALLQEGSSAGVIEQNEHAMVNNVLRLDDRSVASLMVLRSDIVFLDVNKPLEENLKIVMQTPHSRFPVCRNNMDDLIGIVSAKQLLAQSIAGKEIRLGALAKPCNYVPDTKWFGHVPVR